MDIFADVGEAGICDFQRNPVTAIFYSKYTNASNYAVGVHMAGAGYTQKETIECAKEFAKFFSSHKKSQTAWLSWISHSWEYAHVEL